MNYDEFVAVWNSVIVKREDMFALAAALRNVVRIAVLSNTNELNAAVIEGDLRALTSDVILSCRVGLMKPNPEIYRLASERIGLSPGRILFVDDLSENVDGARSAGLIAHLFTGRRELIAILVEHGVLVTSPPAVG